MASILITGGSGFFGRHLVTHLLLENEYDRICIYSRDEAKHASMRIQFNNEPRLRFFIGDVRDKERLKEALTDVDVLVHSAALKRVEICEYSPTEAIKTNIIGALNIIEAAKFCGVKKVVALSTDKAAMALNLYGASKYLMERMFIAANNMHGGRGPKYSCVRYGNVWNSTFSILPIWKETNKRTGVINVTNYDCTRYFMTAKEAVEFVVQTINTMEGGELNIPDWLPAYRVGDLAEVFSEKYGANVNVVGLPSWEKLHESMSETLCSKDAKRLTFKELGAILDETA